MWRKPSANFVSAQRNNTSTMSSVNRTTDDPDYVNRRHQRSFRRSEAAPTVEEADGCPSDTAGLQSRFGRVVRHRPR